MNQSTLQSVYKEFQKEEYFKRFFHQMKCREDRRKFHQQRPIKISIRDNSIVLSRGQTIIIAHLQTQIEPVTYNPISDNFGIQLIKVVVQNNAKKRESRQSKAEKALEHYISSKIDWKQLEKQLIQKDQQTGRQYSNVFTIFKQIGKISIRILGDDGAIEETSLLTTCLLLWTCKIPKFAIKKSQISTVGTYMLELNQFYFPFKYCEVIGQLLVDPSASEEENCDYKISIIKDLLQSNQIEPLIIWNLKNMNGKMYQELFDSIISLWKAELQKMPFDIRKLKERVQASTDSIDLIIDSE